MKGKLRDVIATLDRPDVERVLAVLRREKPDRPVLFEFIVHPPTMVDGLREPRGWRDHVEAWIRAYAENGYDFASIPPWLWSEFGFASVERPREESISQYAPGPIQTWDDFERYAWPDPDRVPYERLRDACAMLPLGMGALASFPRGIFENLIELVGYESLCYMVEDEPDLVAALCEQLGSLLYRFCERMLDEAAVRIVIYNDDWGFKTQTLLAPEDLRRFVFPWVGRIVERCHAAGRPVVLHSCGYMADIWPDIVSLGFDGKHSFEDAIEPIEDALRPSCGRGRVGRGHGRGLLVPSVAGRDSRAMRRDAGSRRGARSACDGHGELGDAVPTLGVVPGDAGHRRQSLVIGRPFPTNSATSARLTTRKTVKRI